MSDTLKIFGKQFNDVAGIRAMNDNDETLTFIRNSNNALTVEDTEDAAGGIVRSIQSVDITDSTITADKILSGYTGYNRLGNKITGTAPTDAMWAKVAETRIYLDEYTDTSAWEGRIDTGINISSQRYTFMLIIITCDSEITTNTEWGMTAMFCTRVTSNGNVNRSSNLQLKGSQVLKQSGVKGNVVSNDYGVVVDHNTGTLTFNRKAHSDIPKIRSGNYTIAVYGLQNIGSSTMPLKDDREDVCEPKDVDFIDFDGKLLYSYTEDEFLGLNSLPPNPVYSKLVAQGWNWTLADAKEFVGQYGSLVIGQNYTTSDGKTRIYLHIPEGQDYLLGQYTLWLTTTVKGGVTIYWGDGTNSVTTANANTTGSVSHTYESTGDYVIEIEVIDGKISRLGGVNSGRNIIGQNYRSATCIEKIEIGNNVTGLGHLPFNKMCNLKSVSIPTTLTSITDYNEWAFWQGELKGIVFPTNFTTNRYRNIFPSYSSVKYVSIPKGMRNFRMEQYPTSLRKLTMYSMEPYSGTDCTLYLSNAPTVTHFVVGGTYTNIRTDTLRESLIKKLFIPSTVTSIAATAFAYNYLLEEVHVYPTTVPSLANTNAFNGIPSTATIYVPYSSDHSILEAYKAATNWSTYASQMVEEGTPTTKDLIAYYDIGDESTISSSGVVTSKVANEFTAWTGDYNTANVPSQALKPSHYNYGYANSPAGMQLYFGQPLSDINSVITIEYLLAGTYNAFSGAIVGAVKNDVGSSTLYKWEIGYRQKISPSNKTFSHRVIILNNTGVKSIYVNGQLKESNINLTDCMTVTCLGIGGSKTDTTTYLGHVRVYNRELLDYEIKNNFKYFKTNCKAGTLAYDSSNNFVGWEVE